MNLALSMTVGSLGPSACLLIWSFYKVVVVVGAGREVQYHLARLLEARWPCDMGLDALPDSVTDACAVRIQLYA